MSKVTAHGLDVVTERSGHTLAPIAPSVCTTPVGTGAVPVPYPVSGTSREGIAGAPSRIKVGGAPVATVGSALSACHGNEPGTLKEIVSHNTGGPVPVLCGAPTVWMGGGMAAFTGSPVLANKGPGSTSRTAPGPMGGPGMVPGVLVLGGGGDSGDEDGDGHGGKDGAGGGGAGGGSGGDGGQKNAPGGQPGQCRGSEPVDVVTGRVYTLPAVDLELPGPLPLVFARTYSTSAVSRDVGLGFGWASSWSWEIEARRRVLVVWTDEGIAVDFPALDTGTEHVGPWGWSLRRDRERITLDTGDGVRRIFAATDETARLWVLVELRDRNDNRIELTYDDAGHLVEVVDSAGRVVRVLMTRSGRIVGLHVYNARARGQWIAVARYAYDVEGNLAAAIDAEGYAARYQYDDEHRLTRHTDRTGLTFRHVYDREGRCVESWGEYPGRRDPSLAEDVPTKLADGTRARGVHHARFDYGPGRYTEVADSTQILRHFGNAHGLVDKRIEGCGVEEARYDGRGLVIARQNGEGAITRYERDGRGQIVRVVDPLGRVTTYERDAKGLPVRVVDPAGGVHEIHRDARGNVIQQAGPTGAAWSYVYDGRGLVTSSTSPTGGVTRFAYDVAGNLVEQIDPSGACWRWEHDTLGRPVREVDPLGHEARFAWTDRGDLAAIFRGEGSTTRWSYDGERRVTEIQGPGQATIGLVWGGFGRLVQQTNAAGGVVRWRYNREGELIEIHNELGEAHRLRRDGGGHLVQEETFDGRIIRYQYDHAGRVVHAETAGEVTTYAYDAAGELVSRTLPDETIETFERDERGDLVRVSWPGGELCFERDPAGRIKREAQRFGGEAHAVASLYDKAGARVRRFTSRGHVEHIERDASGARARTILDEQHDVHHGRDVLGREIVRALPRGGRILHEYDPLGRVQRRSATSPGSVRPMRFEDPGWASASSPAQPDRVTAEREYRYDAAGEMSDAFDRRRGWVQLDYDPAGRLLSALRETTGEAERFRYDAAGNHSEVDGDREVRTYGPGGRLLRRGETTYTWDAAGRLHERRTPREGGEPEVWRYAWDAAGRLAAVELPDGRHTEYAYDPLGRRMETRVLEARPHGGEASTVERARFVWDGDTLVHEIRTRAAAEGVPVVVERTFAFEDGSHAPWAHCETKVDRFGVQGSTWAFYVTDPIGTPEELVGADGAVLAELDRRAWGRTEAVEGARQATALRFQGQIEDAETGLFYNRHRYYDPEAGLYLSPDPLGIEGGLRAWGYGVNPVRWVDPLGLLPDPPPPPTPKGNTLPGYDGKKTEGYLVRPDGSETHLRSGYDGPSAGARIPGMDRNLMAHVEGHTAVTMRRENLTKATLYINRNPCEYGNGRGGVNGCERRLPDMLPPGAQLTVIGPTGKTQTYTGKPDRSDFKTRL
jgi:RHS repeat-associated protein